MSKKVFFAVIISLGLLIIGLASYRYAYLPWWQMKLKKISLGLARADFPYRNYTEAELGKMYPQVRNADVPTRVTPEETYIKFRQGLKENNLQMVLDQLYKDSSRYDGNVASITKAHEEGKFGEIYAKYPEVIKESLSGASLVQYEYNYDKDKEVFVHTMEFIKNANGDWLLDTL